MKRFALPKSTVGFTLIELMVVIVIMGIMASLILTNLNSVGRREAMQAREVLLMDLQIINQQANDQARILALQPLAATDVASFRYQLVEYQQGTTNIDASQKWQQFPDFKTRSLPDRVSFQIEPLDDLPQNISQPDLMGTDTPQLIWFGNGEAKPVRIQFYFEQKALGAEIEIDHLGKVNEI